MTETVTSSKEPGRAPVSYARQNIYGDCNNFETDSQH